MGGLTVGTLEMIHGSGSVSPSHDMLPYYPPLKPITVYRHTSEARTYIGSNMI